MQVSAEPTRRAKKRRSYEKYGGNIVSIINAILLLELRQQSCSLLYNIIMSFF